MEYQRVVQGISLGSRVAEEEKDALSKYFVETENWRKVYQGESDIVFAPKGGGKSAIYSMLMVRQDEFFDRGIVLVTAENPTGGTAFDAVDRKGDTSEYEFNGMWKLYFVTLVAKTLIEYDVKSSSSKELLARLNNADLLPTAKTPLGSLVGKALDYVKRLVKARKSYEASLAVDPSTGIPIATSKITFSEPSPDERKSGSYPVSELFDLAEEALNEAEVEVWILLDRLDILFSDSPALEGNALRALFRVYNDLNPYHKISLKIFLRSDIWEDITRDGFREASHITRDLRIEWNESTLMRLTVQRLLQSQAVRDFYDVDRERVLADKDEQEKFFYRVYPRQVDQGSKKPATFEWCLTRTQDGAKKNAPRELIHLLSETRSMQLNRFEIGEGHPEGSVAFDPQALKDALPAVSQARLTQTLYAEHPSLRSYMEALREQKTRHNRVSLSRVWNTSVSDAEQVAEELVSIGFFEPRQEDYWVPFMYRPALEMVQGSAEGVATRDVD